MYCSRSFDIILLLKGGRNLKKNNLEQNPRLKKKLRIAGIIMISLGLLFMLISIIDFFIALGSFNRPNLFWLFFLAMPLIFAGSICLKFGYMGAVARYTSSELSPVAKDTINYMVDGTKDTIVGAIKEVREEKPNICPSCHKKNNNEAKFCDNCGQSLLKKCLKCHTLNNVTAKFCINCGGSIS